MEDLIVKNVDVMGDSIKAAKDAAGNIWVGVRWVCDALDMTEGQMKRQIKNIKKDLVFDEQGSNQIPLPTEYGIKEVFCIRHDFIPLWLAKISITEKTREERPEFARKLMQYQLKAKDILAAAFLPSSTKAADLRQHITQDIPVGEVARLSTIMDKIMVRQKSKPHDIARAFEMLCNQFGITLPENFVNVPEYEQLTLEGVRKGGTA